MNTDIITLTEIQGTDSVSSSRITINNNFKKLVKAVGDLQTRIDTSKNTLYINVIETESGDFAIKTTPNHTTRFKIDNAGQIFIGSVSLDEYIRRVVSNTKYVELEVLDENDSPMNFQMYSGVETGNEKTNYVTVYYTENDTEFKTKFKVADAILNLYPHAVVYVYDGTDEGEEIEFESGSGEGHDYKTYSLSEFVYTFEFDRSSLNNQRTILINWIPDTAIHEMYSFTLQKIEN